MTRAAWKEAERAFTRRVGAPSDAKEDDVLGRPRKDRWTRWGRGSCEGYSLELGQLIRLGVTHYPARSGSSESWGVSLNGKGIGSFPSFEEATAFAENEARSLIEPAWADWQAALAKSPAKRRIRAGRRR